MDLSAFLSFGVEFDLSGYPTLKITDTSAFPGGAVIDDIQFSVQQPDGIELPCPNILPGAQTQQLIRLAADNQYARGQYVITMRVYCETDESVLKRTFEMAYETVKPKLVEDFDLLTPKLLYKDETIYDVIGFTVTSAVTEWQADINGIGEKTSNTGILDLIYLGEYYSAEYLINFEKFINYQSDVYSWLTVKDRLFESIGTRAVQPPSLQQILVAINALRLDAAKKTCGGGCDLFCTYTLAVALLQNIITAISVDDVSNLGSMLEQLINISKLSIAVTDDILVAWDYTAIVSVPGGGLSIHTIEDDIIDPVTSYTASILENKTIDDVFIGGIRRKCVEGTASDVPAEGTFIFVKAAGQLKYGGVLELLSIVIKYH